MDTSLGRILQNQGLGTSRVDNKGFCLDTKFLQYKEIHM